MRSHSPRLVSSLLTLALVASFAASPALAWWSDREKRSERRAPEAAAESGPFTLESGLLARVPEVAAALEAVRVSPRDVSAWRVLGTELSERAAHADSLRAFERAIGLAPEDPVTLSDYGAALLRAEEFDEAAEVLEEALEIEPFLAIAHYNLGLVYQAQNRYDDAMESFKRALLLEPELADPEVNPGAVNNPDLPYVKLSVYLETAGATPALFGRERNAEGR